MDGVKNNKKLLNDPCISQHLRHRWFLAKRMTKSYPLNTKQ
jgi:hypothetical protein